MEIVYKVPEGTTIENIEKTLQDLGIEGSSFKFDEGTISVIAFSKDEARRIIDKFKTTNYGFKGYKEQNSRYLDNRNRQDTYRSWLNSKEAKSNRSLYNACSKALAICEATAEIDENQRLQAAQEAAEKWDEVNQSITEETDELPETSNIPIVLQESPRAILAREMSVKEIQNRISMMARDFSDIVSIELSDAIERKQEELAAGQNPDRQLKLAEELAILRDPIKGRRKIVEDLGLENIIKQVKQRYSEWLNSSDKELEASVSNGAEYGRDAYQKVLDNFDVLFEESLPLIERLEGIRLTRGDVAEVQDSDSAVENEEEVLGDDETGNRVNGNEGYSFKVRFLDPVKTARAETRRALSNIVAVTPDGQPILDDLGYVTYLREDYVHSTLLAILSKASSPEDFYKQNEDGTWSFPLLEKYKSTYPWISQVTDQLYYDDALRSTFYNDFRKTFVPYYSQRDDAIFPLNSPIDFESTMDGVRSSYELGMLQDKDSIFDAAMNIIPENIKKGQALEGSLRKRLQTARESDVRALLLEVKKLLNMLGFKSENLNLAALEDLKEWKYRLGYIVDQAGLVLDQASKLKQGQHLYDATSGFLRNIARAVGKVTELDASTTFKQNGKTYASYTSSNYIETLFNKFLVGDKEFLEREFGSFEWFKNKNGEWQNEILRRLMEDPYFREKIALKNIFVADDIEYSDWTPTQIASIGLKEYFSIPEDPMYESEAFYNFPIFSDTTMATFMKLPKYISDSQGTFKEKLLPLYRKLVKQELKRIALVERRNKQGVPAISNFDKRGLEFCFLPELNHLMIGEVSFLDAIRQLNSKGDIDGINSLIDKAVTSVMDNLYQEFMNNHSEMFEDDGDLSNFIKNNARVSTKEGVLSKVEEYIWNQVFASSQMVQLVVTDLAFFKDSVDFQKRFKQVYASGTRLNTSSQYGKKFERTIYIKDAIVTSPTYKSLDVLMRQAYEEGRLSKMDYDSIMQKFRDVNATDGQAFRSLNSYRSLMDMMGSWTPEMEEAFERIKNGKWNIGDINAIWQTVKPFVYTQVRTPDGLGNFIKVPHQNKNSEFVLLATYQALSTALNKDTNLRGISKFMEDYDIDVIQFESAVKVGLSGVIDVNLSPLAMAKAMAESKGGKIKVNGAEYPMPNLEGLGTTEAFKKIKEEFDGKLVSGSIDQETYNKVMEHFTANAKEAYEILVRNAINGGKDVKSYTENDYNPITVHSLDYNDYMIVQPTPEHLLDTDATQGSQGRNLIVSDLPDDIEIKLDGKTLKGKEEVRKEYYSLILANLIEDNMELLKDVRDVKSLHDRLTKLVRGNPKYGRDMLDALALIDYNGRQEFNISLSDPSISNKVQELVLSIFKNGITKQKVKGAACILVSNFGFTDELEVVRNEDGSVQALQCYLPAYSRKFYEPYLVKEVRTSKDGQVFEGYRIDLSRMREDDKKLLEFIGYRIPTEGKYSMLPLVIKGFLPQQNGSSIMLPAEVTTLSGSNFEIDRLYMMLPEFRMQEYDMRKAREEYARENEMFNKILSTFDNSELAEDLRETEPEDFKEWFNKNKDKFKYGKPKARVIKYDDNKSYFENSRAARNNRVLEIMRKILQNKSVGEDLQNPGGFDGLKRTGKAMDILTNTDYLKIWMETHNITSVDRATESLLNASLEEVDDFLKKYKVDRNPLTLETFIHFHQQNMTGGALIGMYANNTTMQAKFQDKSLSLREDYVFEIDGRPVKSLTDVYTEETVNGKVIKTKISRNCAQFSAASVDNVKDPVLNSFMQNRSTAHVAAFMLRAGFSIPQIGILFNSPIVKETIKTTGGLRRLKDDIADYTDQLAKLISNDCLNIPTPKAIDTGMVARTIAKTSMFNTLSEAEQLEVMKDNISHAQYFLYVASLADALRTTVASYRADSPNGAISHTIAGLTNQVLAVDNLVNNAVDPTYPLIGTDRALRNGVINPSMSKEEMLNTLIESELPLLQGFYSLGIEQAKALLQKYFVQLHPFVQKAVNKVADNSRKPLKEKDINAIYSGIMLFSLSNTELFGGENMETMREYYLNKFPDEFNRIVKSNPDIAEIPIIKKLTTTSKGIQMRRSSRNSAMLSDMLMRSFDSMLYIDNPTAQELAIHLFRYAYFNEGLSFGPNNFSQYFSALFKSSLPEYVNTLRDLNSTIGASELWERFLPQFYANYGYKLVPTMPAYTIIDRGTVSVKLKDAENRNFIEPVPYEYMLMKGEKETSLYRLDEFTIGNENLIYYKFPILLNGKTYNMNLNVEKFSTTFTSVKSLLIKIKKNNGKGT